MKKTRIEGIRALVADEKSFSAFRASLFFFKSLKTRSCLGLHSPPSLPLPTLLARFFPSVSLLSFFPSVALLRLYLPGPPAPEEPA